MMDENTKARLTALVEKYRASMPSKLETLQIIWTQGVEQGFDKNVIQALGHSVHKLSGSAASYGFEEISEVARTLDLRINDILKSRVLQADPNEEFGQDFERLCDCMRLAADSAEIKTPIAKETAPPQKIDPDAPSILLLDDDIDFTDKLAEELGFRGFRCSTAHNGQAALKIIQEQRPRALVMDVELTPEERSFDVIPDIRKIPDYKPVIVFISSKNDLHTRSIAAKSGALSFFKKPINIDALSVTIDGAINAGGTRPFRLMVMDDDPAQAWMYQSLFKGIGVDVLALNNTDNLLQELESFRPEMILLDLNMPGHSGMEVARIVRQHEHFVDVPIAALSVETRAEVRREALESGIDVFMLKGSDTDSLIRVVISRLRRHRRSRNEITGRDALTDLHSREAMNLKLISELERARREGCVLSVGVFEVCGLEQVNEKHGHRVGDQLIRHISLVIRQRMREADVLGHYSARSLIALFPGTGLDGARNLAHAVQERLAAQPFTVGGKAIEAKITSGLVTLAPSKLQDERPVLREVVEAAKKASAGIAA